MKTALTFMALAAMSMLALCSCGDSTMPSDDSIKDVNESITPTTTARSSAEDASAFDPELQQREDNVIILLDGSIPYTSVVISGTGETLNMSIVIEGADHITDFGNYVIDGIAAYEAEFTENERGNLLIALHYESGEDMVAFSTCDIGEGTAGDYGLLRDARSGSAKYMALDTAEDLYAEFPVAAQHAAKNELDQNDVRIYNEVMDVLEAQYNRPEDEIYEEMAPLYGMTASELKQFIFIMMDKIY